MAVAAARALPASTGISDPADAAYERVFMRLWAQRVMLTETGKPFQFDDRPWLREIWDDPHPRIVVEKSAQLGLTTWGYAKALHLAGVHGLTVIFTMPSKDDAGDFVTGRLDKIIQASPHLRTLVGRDKGAQRHRADNTEIKQVGSGVIYFRGTNGKTGALSVPAQALVHDEVDASDQEKLDTYDSRLEGVDPPSARQKYQMSTPTVPGYGIDALFERSTKQEWLVRCSSCRWEGPLDYYDQTDGYLLYMRCTSCGGKLDPRFGRYVAEHPERDTHGYHVSRLLMCIPERPDRLQAVHDRRQSVEHEYLFDNMVLGQKSQKGTMEVDPERVKHNAWKSGHSSQAGPTLFGGARFMGVDQGDTLTVMIGELDPQSPGQVRVVYRARLRDPARGSWAWDEVARLIQSFQLKMTVVDGNPNSSNAHDLALRREFRGRVLCCYYGEDMKTEVVLSGDVRRRAEDPHTSRRAGEISEAERVDITVDRTMSLDGTAADLQSGVFQFPDRVNDPENEEMLRHFAHNIRKPEKGSDGITYRWVRRGGANDYFHTANYLRQAIMLGMQLSAPTASFASQFTITGVSGARARKE